MTASSLNDLASTWSEAMLRVCWQGGIAILVVWTLCRLFRGFSPAVKCWLWRLAYLKIFVAAIWASPVELPLLPAKPSVPPPSAVFDVPTKSVPAVSMPARPVRSPVTAATRPAGQRSPVTSTSTTVWILLFWLAGASCCGCLFAARCWSLRRLRRTCRSIDAPDWTSWAVETAKTLRLSRRPRLAASDAVESPLLLGILRPLVILPAKLLEDCRPSEARMAIAHEFAHLRRHDLLWNWLPALGHITLFFHPLVWLAKRGWHLAQELACDEMAIRTSCVSVADYGNLLLKVHAGQAGRVPSLAAGMGQSYTNLARRLDAMRRFNPRKRRPKIIGVLLLVVVAVLGIVPWCVTAQESRGPVDKVLTKSTPSREATARARLLVVPPETASSYGLDPNALMLTYEKLVTSHVVLKDALKRIPEEHRVDLTDFPEDDRVETVRNNLTVRIIRNTSILELQYRSKDPKSAVAVLNAVIYAYVNFLDRTHRNTSLELMEILLKERAAIEKRLRDREEELRELRPRVRRKPRTELQEKQQQFVLARMALEEELLENHAELHELRQDYGEQHPKVQSVKDRMEAIKAAYRLLTEFRLKAGISAPGSDLEGEAVFTRASIVEQEIGQLRQYRDAFLDRIADIDLRDDSSGVRVSVVEAPRIVGQPSGRKETRPSADEVPSDLIQVGDLLVLTVTTKHSKAGVTVQVKVADDGSADIPLIGTVQLGGLTPKQAAITVCDACADRGVLSDARVDVKLRLEARPKGSVTVVGAVKQPGRYEIPPEQDVRILDAIALAGGLSSEEVGRIVIKRTATNADQPTYLEVSIEKAKNHVKDNIVLMAGDVVDVKPASDNEKEPNAAKPDS